MAASNGAVGDRGLRSGGTRTGFSVRGIGKNRCRPKLLAAVALALVLIVAAVACFGVAPGMSKTARSFSNPWTIYTIDSNGGRWPSVAIDSDDSLHVSYRGILGLTYATNVGGSWVISAIGNVSGGISSLALDSNDSAYISYVTPVIPYSGFLGYATNSGGSWANYSIDSNVSLDWPWGPTWLGLDSKGKVHISYQGHHGYYNYEYLDDLRYATNANGSWEIRILDAFGDYAGAASSLAVDSKDTVHISYHSKVYGNPGLYYATNSNGDWQHYNLVPVYLDGPPYPWSSSIAIDSNDKVHICFNGYSLVYATNANGSWEFSTIDSPFSRPHSDGFRAISLELDSNDKAHVSYFDTYLGSLKYATNANGYWEISTIEDLAGYFGSSLALDSTGNVHIVYTNLTDSVKYATNAEPVIPEFGASGVVVVIMATVCIFVALRRTSSPSTRE